MVERQSMIQGIWDAIMGGDVESVDMGAVLGAISAIDASKIASGTIGTGYIPFPPSVVRPDSFITYATVRAKSVELQPNTCVVLA